jgi:hypothetical protein
VYLGAFNVISITYEKKEKKNYPFAEFAFKLIAQTTIKNTFRGLLQKISLIYIYCYVLALPIYVFHNWVAMLLRPQKDHRNFLKALIYACQSYLERSFLQFCICLWH